jgi:hypothetical protein
MQDYSRKARIWGVSVDPALDERAKAEAARRGMNFSEFVRYCVRFFFDMTTDKPKDGETTP